MDTTVTVSNCEKEPIHIPGAIQPFGSLIAFNDKLIIQHLSENIPGFESLVGQSLWTLFSQDSEMERLRKALLQDDHAFENPFRLQFKKSNSTEECDGFLHRSADLLVLEIETRLERRTDPRVESGLKSAISSIQKAKTLAELCRITVKEIHRISEFERVMIYRFDENWNGEVVAEALSDRSVDSYLGHHFPASDIPSQARAVFLANWLRVIPDVQYQPSRLHPQNSPSSGQPLDMSQSFLRSVSPIHIQYLKNMNVGSSWKTHLITPLGERRAPGPSLQRAA